MSVPYFRPDQLQVQGREALSLYQWGDKLVNHWFCRTCGVYTFHDAVARAGHHRVNLGCVADVDPLALTIEVVDGRGF